MHSIDIQQGCQNARATLPKQQIFQAQNICCEARFEHFRTPAATRVNVQMQTLIVLHEELRIKFWLSGGEGERAICLPRAVVKPGLICLSANAIRRWCISRRLFS